VTYLLSSPVNEAIQLLDATLVLSRGKYYEYETRLIISQNSLSKMPKLRWWEFREAISHFWFGQRISLLKDNMRQHESIAVGCYESIRQILIGRYTGPIGFLQAVAAEKEREFRRLPKYVQQETFPEVAIFFETVNHLKKFGLVGEQ
jgi:hypothetical protein